MSFQLAACAEMLWPDRPMPWRCARLHEMGFAVGLWRHTRHDLDALAATGARFTIMNGQLDGWLGDAEGGARLFASLAETVAAGKRLGVERLCLTGSTLGEGGVPIRQIAHPTGDEWMAARATLEEICALAEREGVTFALENLNGIDHPLCPFSRTGDVLALLKSLDHPRLRMNLDLYHTQIGEGDLIRWAEACLPWVGEIQVADNPGRFEPGTGEVNWAGVAKALHRLGWRGMITFEGWPSGGSEAALEAFRAAFTVADDGTAA